MEDFKQRQKDYQVSSHKKVSHISHDYYRSKSYMKKSEHVRNIIEYPSKF